MVQKKVKKIPFARPYLGQQTERTLLSVDIGHLIENCVDPEMDVSVSNGENCRKLEETICRIHGADHAVVCSSCTQGMMFMLGACGAKGLCQTQSFTWPSTIVAANLQGHEIRPGDIDYEKWAVPRYPMHTKASYALAVDTFGCDVCPVSDVPLFYDRAHSLGVRFKHLGVASAISFSPSKLVTAGEGGAVLTNNERFVKPLTEARNMISRMNEMQALTVLHGLRNLDLLLNWKKETYDIYKRSFPQFQFQEGTGNHQVIGMLLDSKEQRDRVLEALKDEMLFKAYYEPVHLKWGSTKARFDLPVTEDVARRILCLPSWYGLDRHHVVDRIKAVLEGGSKI